MQRLSRTERVLRLFTDVKPGEGATAVMMFANVFLNVMQKLALLALFPICLITRPFLLLKALMTKPF